uniref:PPPDE domain-containing protein n=1 Tax=Romanomermis culicivorax TaxID=13658 RepID=A0A915HSH9_ROMCU
MPYPVKLQVYDVSRGLARTLSVSLLGKYVDGLWHSAIHVYGNEYFFGGNGIAYCPPGGTILGHPTEIVDLGTTEISEDIFIEHLASLSENMFRPEAYHVVDHNCNTFSNEIAQFLTGRTIPSKIRNLSSDIMSTPFGQLIKPMIEKLQGAVNTGTTISQLKNSTKTTEKTSESEKDKAKPGQTSNEEPSTNPHKEMDLD